jgi:hypothetical protein
MDVKNTLFTPSPRTHESRGEGAVSKVFERPVAEPSPPGVPVTGRAVAQCSGASMRNSSKEPTTDEGKAGKAAFDRIAASIARSNPTELEQEILEALLDLQSASDDVIRGVTLGILQALQVTKLGNATIGAKPFFAAMDRIAYMRDEVDRGGFFKSAGKHAIAWVIDPFDSKDTSLNKLVNLGMDPQRAKKLFNVNRANFHEAVTAAGASGLQLNRAVVAQDRVADPEERDSSVKFLPEQANKGAMDQNLSDPPLVRFHPPPTHKITSSRELDITDFNSQEIDETRSLVLSPAIAGTRVQESELDGVELGLAPAAHELPRSKNSSPVRHGGHSTSGSGVEVAGGSDSSTDEGNEASNERVAESESDE